MKNDKTALALNLVGLVICVGGAWAYWAPMLATAAKPGVAVYAVAYGALAYMGAMGVLIIVLRGFVGSHRMPAGVYNQREWHRRVDAALAAINK